jgi:hypothetical protein
MTTTDDILALARNTAPSAGAAADIALFDEAVMHGMNTAVVQGLRTLRDRVGPAALPDSPAWRAWLSATAAIAGASAANPSPAKPTAADPSRADPGRADPSRADPSRADPSRADPSRADPSAANPSPANPGRADPSAPGAADDRTACFVVCAAATALGQDCAAAITAGLEASALVEAGLASAGGWSVPVVSAVIGAGLAAGMMLRLPESQLWHLLGICATQAAGTDAAQAGQAALQAGKAAFNAVEAAQLASLGFTSSQEPLDGRRGLFALFNR